MKMEILIIEDEPFARAELVRLLNATGRDFLILEQLDTVADSVEWLKNHRSPGLIFMDIQLADGLSFDILRQVAVDAPVIFTTAFDEYAIKAFQLNSVDYLLKPVGLEALQNALNKFDKLSKTYQSQTGVFDPDRLEALLRMMNKEYRTRMLLKMGDQLRSAEIGEIAYFYAEDDVVFALLKDKKRYIVDFTLNELEGQLDPQKFFRLNRGCIAEIGSVKKVSKYFNSRLAVELDPPMEDKLLVSRVNVPDFLKWLGDK